jgi:hypothetical protein
VSNKKVKINHVLDQVLRLLSTKTPCSSSVDSHSVGDSKRSMNIILNPNAGANFSLKVVAHQLEKTMELLFTKINSMYMVATMVSAGLRISTH